MTRTSGKWREMIVDILMDVGAQIRSGMAESAYLDEDDEYEILNEEQSGTKVPTYFGNLTDALKKLWEDRCDVIHRILEPIRTQIPDIQGKAVGDSMFRLTVLDDETENFLKDMRSPMARKADLYVKYHPIYYILEELIIQERLMNVPSDTFIMKIKDLIIGKIARYGFTDKLFSTEKAISWPQYIHKTMAMKADLSSVSNLMQISVSHSWKTDPEELQSMSRFLSRDNSVNIPFDANNGTFNVSEGSLIMAKVIKIHQRSNLPLTDFGAGAIACRRPEHSASATAHEKLARLGKRLLRKIQK
jgi:hypothetical protein